MNCELSRQTLLLSLDGPIAAEPCLLMENHLATCEACSRFAALQRAIDARLTAAAPVASLSPAFLGSLKRRLPQHPAPSAWPDSLPDIAHLTGCAAAILLLLVVVPQYSRAVLTAGAAFTLATYFLQTLLRTSLE